MTTNTLTVQPDATEHAAAIKRAVIALGDKGGSSKSFLTRRLYEAHLGTHKSLLGVDADATVGHLIRHYGTDRIIPFDLHSQDGDERERLTNEILRTSDKTLALIDFPATSLYTLRVMANEGVNFVQEVLKAGWRPTILAPITPYDDTIYDLRAAIELFDPHAVKLYDDLRATYANETKFAAEAAKLELRADYVAVLNHGMADHVSDFELWDESDTRKLFHFIGGVEIDFPKLKPRIAAKIAKHRDTFANALKAKYLHSTDESRLASWIESSDKALRKAGPLLGF